ncbi:ATP-dependent endonuclease [Macrococcoides caseolyticum]|uniref:ATP-dependent nuclease n=1 Tax=Macrococcoides caseolyticum TaxID=69966 RepID=UPI000C33E798|nr:AAA family ATPase [Macrococcus caseolyticus]PKE34597.1 ATP-dependent endonuclease [Macrococcus caseolyticus]PKF30132.1 ATP-dependent endonuclease [Macrococcus caseolyticus]STY78271.1 recombination protein F [Macrococcus caseolyticus]
MKIEWIKIKGFRNFDNEKINFAEQTLIIGANDVGKTNLIYALRLLFDRSLSDRDLDLFNSDYNVYTQSNSIEITVKLVEVTEDCLITIFKGDLNEETVYIQYKNSKNSEYVILSGPTEEMLEEKNSRFYIKRLNMEYVNTNRNLESFMKREKNQILEDAKLKLTEEQTQSDEKSVLKIKRNLELVNKRVDRLNYIQESLNKVNNELSLLAIHNEDKVLTYKNTNSDATRMLDNLELTYSTDEGALTLGGDGRNNQIFLATWVSKQKNVSSLEKVTFYAIEEPEAHLHPQQQRKLSSYLLEKFEEQVFITTHSPYIATEFKPDRIVKLYSKNKFTKVAKGGCSEELKMNFDDFGYRLDAITSDVFFVNAVFLVEGPSEKLFYTALAKQLDIDLDRLNVSIISVNGVGFKPYIKICLALDIPFVLRTDNDIFNKTKKVGKKNVEFSFQGGISRVMGIYTELLQRDDNQELIEYWKAHQLKNEWLKTGQHPQVAKSLANYIIQEVEKDNIYISKIDLENDLANSSLFSSLKKFYNTRAVKSTVDKMQKAKAENMLEFLKANFNDLKCLRDDKISEPLKQIKNLAEKVVNENEKSN